MKNTIVIFFLSSCLFLTFPLLGSTQNDTIEIKEVILQLFDGMRAGDSLMVKDAFHETATMHTTAKRADNAMIMTGEVAGFVTSVGMPHEQIYDERLGEYSIQIDDILASFEVKYYFFLGESLSHCGTNFFTLFKSNEGWKIIYIADTRRKETCELPDVTW